MFVIGNHLADGRLMILCIQFFLWPMFSIMLMMGFKLRVKEIPEPLEDYSGTDLATI